ncbi:MAG: PorT family protein [Paludibacteraceae bacterium]|nr:PorT family protein [Paludibacteraceae bacterium]
MKKVYLTALLAAFSFGGAFSQLSVTAGGTYSKWQDDFTSYRLGFNVGALYQALPDSTPFTLAGGLLLSNKGVCLDGAKDYNGGGEYNFRVSSYSVRVPLTVGYKLHCCRNTILVVPQVGLFAEYGVWGKISQTAEISKKGGVEHYVAKYDGKDPYSEIEKLEFQGVKNFERFDWGLHAGVQIGLSKHIYLYGGYDYGMNKVWNTIYFNAKSSSFHLNVGYNFAPKPKKKSEMKEI